MPRIFSRLRGGQPLQSGRLDVDCMPLGIELAREPCRRAHHSLRTGVRTDTREQRIGGFPHRCDGLVDTIGLNVAFDPIGRPAQREFTQGHQIALAEEIVRRPLGLLRNVDFTGSQSLQQLFSRDIDQHDLVGIVKDRVGHRFPYAHIGDPADDVVETLQVLHVQRREYIDARRQEFLDVLPALRVTRSLHVRVGEFVDQYERRVAKQRRIEIEFGQILAPMHHDLRRQDLLSLEQRGGLGAPVSLDHSDDDIPPFGLERAGGRKHGIGLADAGR